MICNVKNSKIMGIQMEIGHFQVLASKFHPKEWKAWSTTRTVGGLDRRGKNQSTGST